MGATHISCSKEVRMDISTVVASLASPFHLLLLLLFPVLLFFFFFRSSATSPSPSKKTCPPSSSSPLSPATAAAATTPTTPTSTSSPSSFSHHHHRTSPSHQTGGVITQNRHYLSVLKGFAGSITCVALHPQQDIVAASCSGDRTVRVVDLSSPAKLRDANPPYVRCAIQGDFAAVVDFSHDGTHILAVKDFSRTLLKIKIAKDVETGRPMQVVSESTEPLHRNRVRWLSASKGNWVVTCSEEDDTEVKVWSYAGDLLASYTTKQVKNFQMSVSPVDGRFIAVAAWSSGVKVMEIVSKASDFRKLDKAMDLKTSKGVKVVGISADNKLAYTVDKGGVHTLWNIDVRYHAGEDPKELLTYEETDPRFANYTSLVFAPDNSRVIAVAWCVSMCSSRPVVLRSSVLGVLSVLGV
eukprot:GHVS01042291.1.p1 GENE.GHVS01042291.1~~GHVS01042291.1.p1  ORF type:complete len:411 (-),score=91.10 GHVS01042291.1:330-1562(-)